MKHLLIALATLLSIQTGFSQTTGQNEPGIDWQVMKSPKVNVVFEPGMEARAKRISNIINYMADHNTGSIGEASKRKVDLILRSRTAEPNGYVGLAPHRSEFFATPPEELNLLGSNDWLDLLTIHEYRHVQQNYNQRRGLANLFYFLQGEAGWLGFNVVAIPNWFSEGDAVIAETTLTSAGRGRTPNFMAVPRAMAHEGVKYNYNKWRNGSFDEQTPDHYRLGYMMLTHLRNEYGSEMSEDVLHKGSKVYQLYPFSSALKSKTGMSTTDLYNQSWSESASKWNAHVATLNITKTNQITEKHGTVTNYSYPQYDANGSLISSKSSYKKTEYLVRIDVNGKEKKILNKGISLSRYINLGNNKIVWTEIAQNARRNNSNYSNIHVHNLTTGKTKQLTHKGKYFSPVVSADGNEITAVSVDNDQNCHLYVLDADSGIVKHKIQTLPGEYIFNPTYASEQEIVYIKKIDGKLGIFKYNFRAEKETQLSPISSHVINTPRVANGKVYFSASYSQIDNIYSVSIDGSQEVTQVTSVPVGAYEPAISPDGRTLAMTEITTGGKVISTMPLANALNKTISIIEPVDQKWLDKGSAEFEGGDILKSKIPNNDYEVDSYDGLFRGIRLHSWNLGVSATEPSIGLNFNNALDDVSILAEGGYNINEEQDFYGANLRIARYFPIIDIRAKNSGRSADYLTMADTIAEQTYRETSFGGDVSIPFNSIKGNFFRSFSIGAGADYRITQDREIEEVALDDKTVTTAKAFASYSNIRRRAIQNMRSRLGISLDGTYYRDITDEADEKLQANASLFLPGILANHSLKISGGYQKELLTNSFQISDDFQYSRGYDDLLNDEVYRVSADYALPLLYPDFGIAGITYFKRISLNLFYDYGKVMRVKDGFHQEMNSLGGELIFDNQFLNLLPIQFGIRYAERLNDTQNQNKSGAVSIFLAQNF